MIWLVNSSLYFYSITSQHNISNRKIQLCQGRTEWCQQITVQEHLFDEFVLVHLTFGSCTSPTETSPFTYHPFNGPGMCAVDNFQRLIFGNSQSPENFKRKPEIVSLPTSFTGKCKIQINVYVYIYIEHHLRGRWHSPISKKVLTCHR